MVRCLYLNPTIDKTIYLDRLIVDGTNRYDRVLIDGAGKAVNVAIALSVLEQKSELFGFIYKSDGDIIKNRLQEFDVTYRFVELDGVSRTNIKLFDMQCQQVKRKGSVEPKNSG